MKKNIVVIFGGKSTEHDISIISAMQVINALNEEKYNKIPVYITHSGKWLSGEELFDINFYKNFKEKKLKEVAILPNSDYLFEKRIFGFKPKVKVDCVVLVCHGKNGEDGTVQGLLELSNIPYSSSGVIGSANGLDKILMKRIFKAYNLPVCDFVELTKKRYDEGGLDFVLKQIKLPVVVKPNSLGSSIGVSVCDTAEELEEAINLCFVFDNKIVIEKKVENLKEVNMSVLGDGENCICSVSEEPVAGGLLTFEKKYLADNSKTTGTKSENLKTEFVQNENIKVEHATTESIKASGKKAEHTQNENIKTEHVKTASLKTYNVETEHTKSIELDAKVDEEIVEVDSFAINNCAEYNADIENISNFENNSNIKNNSNTKNNEINMSLSHDNQQKIKTDGNLKGGSKNGMQNLSRIVPANITKKQEKEIIDNSTKIFEILNCKGVVRIDYMINTEEKKIYVNEINTIPGSFAFYLWEKTGIKFDELLDKIIDIAIISNKNNNKLITTFNSNVLTGNYKSSK